ncbi:MAG: hypothetical protein HY329_17085 [Chloroflexi bacterium]|nr:hypothetical protein [Chloroflexota bacterium]
MPEQPTSADLRRLWPAVQPLAPPHWPDASTLGEYAELLVVRGAVAAATAFPQVASHLGTGCDVCAVNLGELVDLLEVDDRLVAVAAAAAPVAVTATDLFAAARERGYEPASLASELRLGVDVLAKLQQRLIRPETLPTRLLERLGELLVLRLEQVQGLFAAPEGRVAPAGAFFYAKEAPAERERQTFGEAIRASRTMTAAQRFDWLRVAGESPDDLGASRPRRPGRRPKR